MTKYMVIYRKHGELNCQTKHVGPFESFDDAYDALCEMPALGMCAYDEPSIGHKYITELYATLEEAELRTE